MRKTVSKIGLLIFAVYMMGAMIPSVGMAKAEIDERSQEVLDKLGKYVGGLDSVQVDLTVTMNVKTRGMDQEMVTGQTVSVQKPNKLAMVLTEGEQGSSVYSDGTDLITHLPMTQKYYKEDAPASFAKMDSPTSMIGLQMMGLPAPGIVSHLWSDDPAEALTEFVDTVSYVGEGEIDGEKFHKLMMELETADVEIWISDSDKPVIQKLVPDMAKTLAQLKKQFGSQLGEVEMSLNIAMKDWKYNPEFTADTFTFTPPEGASLASTTRELMGMDEQPQQMERAEPTDLIGKPAENFVLDLLDGGQFELANEKGKSIVILDFFATWCGPCRSVMPSLEELSEEYKDKNVKLVAVNQGESPAQIKSFLSDEGLHPIVVLDKNGMIASKYNVSGIPQTVIVGKDGTVQAVHVGAMPGLKDIMAKELDTLISGKSLAN